MSPAVPTYDFSVWSGLLREFQEQVFQQSQAEAEMPLMTHLGTLRISCHLEHSIVQASY